MSKKIITLYLLLCLGGSLSAQSLAGERNLDKSILFYVGYGPISSAGDLADRFGNGWSIDGGLSLMPAQKSLEIGLRVQFGFGNQIKEDVLANLRTTEGFLIGNQREPADVLLRQRQLFIGPSLGYTFKLGDNQRAGIHTKTSIGYFFSRIAAQNDGAQGVSPLNEEFLAGYDRLAGGPAIHQFIGYQQLASDRLLNFYVGAEVMAGFTNQLR
ncbi:MAG: hypothetical protein AAF597_11880, partial [Bacteroidota bacterium]